MAPEETIDCSACGMDISINETQCPECGHEIDDEEMEDRE